MNLLNNFLEYIKIETTSDPNSLTNPSSINQFILAKLLVNQLKAIGVKEAFLDDKCYVYAYIPGNKEKDALGFISHLDTSPDASGLKVNPKIIKNYDGKDIILNLEKHLVLSPNDFLDLYRLKGKTLITTDGNTLLGADDKAGIAIIMQAIYEILNKKDLDYPDIYLCFTPDEEIGKGADNFNYDFFKAKYAFTLDGSRAGEISYENFNAASAIVTAKGVSIHPGDSKNKMINASLLLMEFHKLLPSKLDPSLTEKREGFNHLTSLKGQVEKATAEYIIRNHDLVLFKKQKDQFLKAQKYINDSLGYDAINVEITDSYYNMALLFKGHEDIINLAINATKMANITPIIEPIRGGTDGARLSYQGLLCPNLGTGGYNFHGPFEYACLEEMEDVVKIIINIIKMAK